MSEITKKLNELKTSVNETDAVPFAGTSSYKSTQSARNVDNVQVAIDKDTIPNVDTSDDQANRSKENVNLAHVKKRTGPIPNTSPSVFGIKNMVSATAQGCNISIGNKYHTTYITRDYSDYGSSSSRARNRNLTPVSEELKSSILPLSVDNKYLIADNIGNNWKRLARMLPDADFTDGQLDNIKQGSENQTELVINVLNKWHEGAPKTATVGNLAKTLEKMHLNNLALALENHDTKNKLTNEEG